MSCDILFLVYDDDESPPVPSEGTQEECEISDSRTYTNDATICKYIVIL